MALLPVANKTLMIYAVTASQDYSYASSGPITLEVGHLYHSLTVPMKAAYSRSGYGNVNNI